MKRVLSSGIQLLGNLVVDHDENQELVWNRCYPYFFRYKNFGDFKTLLYPGIFSVEDIIGYFWLDCEIWKRFLGFRLCDF